MLPPSEPGRIRIAFDDHRLVSNAGLILPVTLAQRLGSAVNSSAITLTWETRRGGRTRGTRC